MTCKSVFKPAPRLAGAALAFLIAAAPEVRAACSDPAGLEVDRHDCDLKQVDLSYAILSGANLLKADLSGAGLEGVVLIRANLTDADLTGANLSGATWTDGAICAEGSIGECK